MQQSILGLHHVTATVNEAQPDLDFYRNTLGLRLVKKTVNFDKSPQRLPCYYGDVRGRAGTIWTTFPYGGWGVAPGRRGAGQITTTSFSVPAGSLPRWMLRLQDKGVLGPQNSASGRNAIIVTDPSGLRVRLIEAGATLEHRGPGTNFLRTWPFRGLHGVTLGATHPGSEREAPGGARGRHEAEELVQLAVNGDLPGHGLELGAWRRRSSSTQQGGHGAPRCPGHYRSRRKETAAARTDLSRHLCTEVLDRPYFRSIYFREPGGVSARQLRSLPDSLWTSRSRE